jgi:hypothetical protein
MLPNANPSTQRILFALFIVAIAAGAAMLGAMAGGVFVYRSLQDQLAAEAPPPSTATPPARRSS